ncbi:2-C-methyl-D-erythritol 4-phosphate cytidylyltransferase [Pedobacter cryoconitis]|uniref:2-C-methyl-D-erythritol 4-phosphate cytidylyltransferase n=1 Tax=Pedobacter cryoconitis TaxID=188932 RepID=A0A7W8ZRE5_9SPHI|nr:2-C-methyl-D-erythritol 4-phosphate cytidylyltransferase [Pedobacter cryoconitis]MBB5638819.1 2-C-methyl-D-erythritol 4-phosphate cytidylyltransferase [Pedobacter cryoconitis]MBB6270172.1 2-C-methyl-D-erythritol 4-phosphate cytidylyltransferase [Pedobacter cryoconitis]
MKYYAIIVAGGKGNRMNLAVAKQFLELDGKPILMHTLEAFNQCVLNPEIILVLNIHQHLFWEELCIKHDFKIPHQVIKGGQERFDSVRNGLKNIKGKAIVAIHDAVRPLVNAELILQSYQMAEEKGNAIAAIQPVDSVRIKRDGQDSEALSRDELYLIQTPQTFQVEQLRKAYLQPYRNEFTDDASVVERAGFSIHLLPGDRSNIKITYQQDLEMASFLLKKKGF